MEPNQIHPFNKRSFYVPDGMKDIGGGIELWRGIFQSVRPTVGRLIVNIDLSTGMMYKQGPLLNLCIDFFGRAPNTSPLTILAERQLRDIERVRLQKFLSGVRVRVFITTGDRERVVRGLTKQGANRLTFSTREGTQMTVAEYFQSLGVILQYPSVICAVVRNQIHLYASFDKLLRLGRMPWYLWSSAQFPGVNLCEKKSPMTKSRPSWNFLLRNPMNDLKASKAASR